MSITTTPDSTGGPNDEQLSAPGQSIEIDASSSQGLCVNGTLQYRFAGNGGEVIREWSENSVIVDSPQVDTDYTVQVRCTSDPTALENSCDSSALTVNVDVSCPASGNLGFGNPQLVMSADDPAKQTVTASWPASFAVDVIVGNLYSATSPAGTLLGDSGATGVYTDAITSCLLEDTETDSFTDGVNQPADSGDAIFWLVKPVTGFCNVLGDGSYSHGGTGELAGRDATIPLTAPGCM